MNKNFLQQDTCSFCDDTIKHNVGLFRLIIIHNKKRFCSQKCKRKHIKKPQAIHLTVKECLSPV